MYVWDISGGSGGRAGGHGDGPGSTGGEPIGTGRAGRNGSGRARVGVRNYESGPDGSGGPVPGRVIFGFMDYRGGRIRNGIVLPGSDGFAIDFKAAGAQGTPGAGIWVRREFDFTTSDYRDPEKNLGIVLP